jgi:hypothetical protein
MGNFEGGTNERYNVFDRPGWSDAKPATMRKLEALSVLLPFTTF